MEQLVPHLSVAVDPITAEGVTALADPFRNTFYEELARHLTVVVTADTVSDDKKTN
jgi:hypothetical protein